MTNPWYSYVRISTLPILDYPQQHHSRASAQCTLHTPLILISTHLPITSHTSTSSDICTQTKKTTIRSHPEITTPSFTAPPISRLPSPKSQPVISPAPTLSKPPNLHPRLNDACIPVPPLMRNGRGSIKIRDKHLIGPLPSLAPGKSPPSASFRLTSPPPEPIGVLVHTHFLQAT
ncbi:hypothetical protein NA56DRAFT_96689 [Hyaloscypha hepaticicola]|uniref:Uncharacterized protein n=1 Tax=Hyaloscypha hepaticicola TaxID=2082293 RepID=A0A2J6Q7F3_9HELO|nr:hypothetical protein NA56DRAFT_96689 [Hyaloscypha hepaticicola]